MQNSGGFFNKKLAQSLAAITLMASPEGTTLEELSRRLSLTRRSVFRLLRTIARDFHIPILVNRKEFGGRASYCLPPVFVNKLSGIVLPALPLTFEQAALVYLLAGSAAHLNKQNDICLLRDAIMALYDTPEYS
jgi:hypothetical protein